MFLLKGELGKPCGKNHRMSLKKLFLMSCTSQQSNVSACRENDVSHVSAIYSSAFGKHIMHKHKHIQSQCCILVTYHILAGKSQH